MSSPVNHVFTGKPCLHRHWDMIHNALTPLRISAKRPSTWSQIILFRGKKRFSTSSHCVFYIWSLLYWVISLNSPSGVSESTAPARAGKGGQGPISRLNSPDDGETSYSTNKNMFMEPKYSKNLFVPETDPNQNCMTTPSGRKVMAGEKEERRKIYQK